MLGRAMEPGDVHASISGCQRLVVNWLLTRASRRWEPVWAAVMLHSSHSPVWKVIDDIAAGVRGDDVDVCVGAGGAAMVAGGEVMVSDTLPPLSRSQACSGKGYRIQGSRRADVQRPRRTAARHRSERHEH